jgi:hypothetical protein
MNRYVRFDIKTDYRGHKLRLIGRVSPGYPERGPSYDCGGTPAEPAEIEEISISMVRGKKERPLEDRNGDLADALYDTVMEALADYD